MASPSAVATGQRRPSINATAKVSSQTPIVGAHRGVTEREIIDRMVGDGWTWSPIERRFTRPASGFAVSLASAHEALSGDRDTSRSDEAPPASPPALRRRTTGLLPVGHSQQPPATGQFPTSSSQICDSTTLDFLDPKGEDRNHPRVSQATGAILVQQ